MYIMLNIEVGMDGYNKYMRIVLRHAQSELKKLQPHLRNAGQ